MTELNTEDLVKSLGTESQANAGYGMAVGMTEGAVSNVLGTGGAERRTNLESEVARRKQAELEKKGASEIVARLAASCIELRATADEAWSKGLSSRSDGRLDSAKARRASLDKIEQSKNSRLQADEKHAALKAMGEQVSPGSVRKDRQWFPARALEWMKSGVENAASWFHETRVFANEVVATKYEKKSKVWEQKAVDLRAEATRKRAGYPDVTTALQAEITKNAPTPEAVTQAQGRAEYAQNTLDNIRNNDYFAPEATELHDKIVEAGGDKSFKKTKAATQEWQARATGSTTSI